ncbi:MAG: SDR family oxidoreductase [Candidatus Methanoplasma sp.]|jgi:NAD(P)-dependent dehydrogenase (short-subunit alcohol dehydrogenase family)|nr:SDR family oxidoreductase [Candidatus Methanoplasma sp.]
MSGESQESGMMKDKVVLITGATGGIGSAAARLFALHGAKLAVQSTSETKLAALKASLGLSDDRFAGFVLDVSDESAMEGMVKCTVAKYGKLDMMINNAGYGGAAKSIMNLTAEEFRNVLNVNVFGVFYGLKHGLRQMKTQGYGSIVNTASITALYSGGGVLCDYVASKHAVLGLTRSAAIEAIKFGVRVNAVAPGPVDDRMMRALELAVGGVGGAEAARKELVKNIPDKRYATTEDIANGIFFLASDEASHIVGFVLAIDGGELIA